MSWRKALTLIAIILSIVLVTRWQCTAPKSDEVKTKATSKTMRSQSLETQNGMRTLARALSLAAAHTVGLTTISGRVLHQATGKPIPNAEVFFTGYVGENSVFCDDVGAYRIELSPGFYRSYARAEGFVAVAPPVAQRLPGPVSADEVAAPRENTAPLLGVFRNQTKVNLSLSPAFRIYGHVRDGEGQAISGAIVSAIANGGHRVITGDDVTESDGSGFYEVQVPVGSVHMEANHEEYAGLSPASQTSTFSRSSADEKNLDLVLIQGCIVEGTVVGPSGELILEGAFEQRLTEDTYTPIGEIRSGQVRFASPSAGEVELRAWPWKHPPSETIRYSCEPGSHYMDEVFVVPNSNPSLSGFIEDADGTRVPLAFIDLFSLLPGGNNQQERADEQGEFSFHQLPEGPYQLSAYVPGSGVDLTTAGVPSTGVPLRLRGTGSLLGSLGDEVQGVMRMTYQCALQLDKEELAQVDLISMPKQTLLVPLERGRFRIDKLPACPLHGTIMLGKELHRFKVEVIANQDTVLQLVL